ncbi:MAG: AgmX/PglI C-terminal domain-containing protein [Sandaracinaceae bacterium]|nr:AgmX/PglI C-terminal domain-containing protein [Sandaracinaceae bacterium]
MKKSMKQYGYVLVALALAACGGAEESGAQEESSSASSAGGERRREPDDGLAISGLMGTIRQDQVQNALNPRMPRFQRCFEQRMRAVELLGGDIRLAFRIRVDGTVLWVYPAESDIGDRDTERCVLEVAASTQFPRPSGGEAEFRWGFGLDIADGVRPPLHWQADALGRAADAARQLGRQCQARGEGHTITAYIAPGGALLAAGGTMPDETATDALECILAGVRALPLPDPGSYPAKITFTVR